MADRQKCRSAFCFLHYIFINNCRESLRQCGGHTLISFFITRIMTISLRWVALLLLVVVSACFFLVVLFITTSEGKRSLPDIQTRHSASDTSRGSENGISDDRFPIAPSISQHLSTSDPSYLDGRSEVPPSTIVPQETNLSSQDSSPNSPLRPNSSLVVNTANRLDITSRTISSDGSLNQSQANKQSTISPANRSISRTTEIPTSVPVSSTDTLSAATTEQTARSASTGGAAVASPVNGVGKVGGVGEEDRSVSVIGSGNSPSTAEYPEVETPQQFQTQFGDSAYSKAVTDRLVEESNRGKP